MDTRCRRNGPTWESFCYNRHSSKISFHFLPPKWPSCQDSKYGCFPGWWAVYSIRQTPQDGVSLLFSHISPVTSQERNVNVNVKVAQSCLTLCKPMDYTVHGILQARILEWVAFPFSRGSSQPRDRTQVFHIAGGFFTSWATKEALLREEITKFETSGIIEINW